MGMEGATLAGIIGSSLLGGIMAPEGQELKSFHRTGGGVSPHDLMGETGGILRDYLSALTDRADEDITLRTTANPLPSFVGGSLPMPISVPGMDTRRLNPDLRTTSATTPLRKRSLSGTNPADNAPRWPKFEMDTDDPYRLGANDAQQAQAALRLIMPK